MNAKIAIYRINQGIKVTSSLIQHNLLWITIYITEKCNSKCKICGIWKKKDPMDMSFILFKDLIDGTTNKTYINITGGEALLHPQIDEILDYLAFRNRPYTLFSNGILADDLIEKCVKFKVKSLTMSCDGPRDTYQRIRGVDNFDNIAKIVNALKSRVNIAIDYTVNSLNTREDLDKIKKFCDNNKIHLGVGLYGNVEYFDTNIEKQKLYNVDGFVAYPANRFVRLYNDWVDGKIRLPCYSVRFSCAILPDGSVSMCQAKKIILGKLDKSSLNKIWNSDFAREMQRKHKNCNSCWIVCQRGYDVGLAIILNHLFPKRILNRLIGNYDWSKI